jgi:DNA-binding NarL/FixJ family response regulator
MCAAPIFLLVEPSSFVHSIMREWLENALTDFRILIAENEDDALRLAAPEQPKHILIETFLLDTPGFTVLQQLRQSMPAARIIATHWYESRLFLKRVRSAGEDGFVPKHDCTPNCCCY